MGRAAARSPPRPVPEGFADRQTVGLKARQCARRIGRAFTTGQPGALGDLSGRPRLGRQGCQHARPNILTRSRAAR